MSLAAREESKIAKLLQYKLRETKRSRTTPIHPRRLTWNLHITHLERNIFQNSMIMFHPGYFAKGYQVFYMHVGSFKWLLVHMLKIRRHLDNHLRLPDAPPQPFLEGLSMPSPTLNLIDAKELKEYFFEKKKEKVFLSSVTWKMMGLEDFLVLLGFFRQRILQKWCVEGRYLHEKKSKW